MDDSVRNVSVADRTRSVEIDTSKFQIVPQKKRVDPTVLYTKTKNFSKNN